MLLFVSLWLSCQVMDGRKPTGGRVEVKIRLREPLSGQDMQSSTERWLVIDSSQVALNTHHSVSIHAA